MDTSKRFSHCSDRPTKERHSSNRFIWQLTASALIFALWMSAQRVFPQAMTQWEKYLSGLLGASCDLTQACVQLGEDLSNGEDVVVSVGNWCQTVFLPGEEDDGAAD